MRKYRASLQANATDGIKLCFVGGHYPHQEKKKKNTKVLVCSSFVLLLDNIVLENDPIIIISRGCSSAIGHWRSR